MLEAMKNLQAGKVNLVKDTFLYPLLVWNSGARTNIPICNKVNKLFFKVKPKILKGMLSLGLDKSQRFIKYPKKLVEKDKKLLLLKPYIKQGYGWSERDWNNNLSLVKPLIEMDKFIQILHKKVGFEKKECKILDIEVKKVKVEKLKMSVNKSLFGFGG